MHDWSLSARIVRRATAPVFLAGGLNPMNVGEATGQVRPFGLDLCSGVRTGGALDPGLLWLCMANVRGTGDDGSATDC